MIKRQPTKQPQKATSRPTDKGDKDRLSDKDLEKVAGGRMINPQPDPPG